MSVKRNIVANYLGQAWTTFMGIAFVPIYIRYLGMEAYGLIGLFAVIQACLSLLDMGMTPTLNREMARFTAGSHNPQSIRDLLRSVEVLCCTIAAAAMAAVIAASGYIAGEWLHIERLLPDEVIRALSVMAVVVALRFLEGIYRSALFGLQRQVLFNSVSAVFATLRHAGVVAVLAWGSSTIQVFFLWQAGVSLASVAALATSVHRTLPPSPMPARFSSAAIAGVWRFAGGVMGITIVATVLTQVDKLLLSRLLSLETFGYYTLAATIAGIPYIIIGPVVSAVYPRLVELQDACAETALVSTYHQGAQLVTVLTAPFAAVLFCFGAGAVFAWSGDPSLAGKTAPILSALVVASFLNGLIWMPYHCQLAHGWTRLVLIVNVVGMVVLVPGIMILAPRYGAVSAAWLWAGLNVGNVLATIHWMHRRILTSEKWRWYWADVTFPTLGAVAVPAAAIGFAPGDLTNRLHWIGFLVLVSMIAIAAAAVLGDHLRARLWRMTLGRAASR